MYVNFQVLSNSMARSRTVGPVTDYKNNILSVLFSVNAHTARLIALYSFSLVI